MTTGITVKRQFHVRHGRSSHRQVCAGVQWNATSNRVPRIARLIALAIHLDQLIQDEVVADQAELARLGHVSRARLTQIMNLLQLAPDIQEELLFLSPTERGRDMPTERELRPIAATTSWSKQRKMWQRYLQSVRRD